MQRAPNLSALRAPFQFFTGWGSFQRRSPTGGAANGIPLKLRTPSFDDTVDSTTPLAVLTRSAANVLAPRNPQRSKASANLSMKFPFAADFPEIISDTPKPELTFGRPAVENVHPHRCIRARFFSRF